MQGCYRQQPHEVGLRLAVGLKWLLRLWDDGADAVYFTKEELSRMEALPQDPRMHNILCTLHQQNQNVSPSLMEWVLGAARLTWPTTADINGGLTAWTTIAAGLNQLWQLGMLSRIYSPEFTGPDQIPMSKTIRNKMLRTALPHLKAMVLPVIVGKQADKCGKERVSRGTMLQDLLRAGIPWQEVDSKPGTELLEQWLQLHLEQHKAHGGWEHGEQPGEHRGDPRHPLPHQQSAQRGSCQPDTEREAGPPCPPSKLDDM
uniref:Uncharacterized protein n=1 Tax=Apteryx owenii TaxID=8824 RepID=A0A8B9QNA2_APTOW